MAEGVGGGRCCRRHNAGEEQAKRPYQHAAVLSKSGKLVCGLNEKERCGLGGGGCLIVGREEFAKGEQQRCRARRCSCPEQTTHTRSCNEAFKRANIDNFLGIFCLSESTTNLGSSSSLSLSLRSISLTPAIHRFPLVVRSTALYLLSTRTRHAACSRVFAKLRRFEVPASSSWFRNQFGSTNVYSSGSITVHFGI